MKKIEISLQRKIAAVAICIALAVVTYILISYICREWLHMNSDFLRIFSRSCRSRHLQGPYRVVDRGED